MPTTVLTFWVLMAAGASTTSPLLAQQFLSQSACEKAKHFLEERRGTYISATCIEDRAPAAPRAPSGNATPKEDKKP